jgi:hypothetical protein
MRTFIVPALEGEDMSTYQMRVSGMAWQFVGPRELSVPQIGTVILDGDQPEGAGFEEIV